MIRGHLVRKQAIATLQCMQGIVKMQAIVRGNRVRCSDIGLAVGKFRNQEKPVVIFLYISLHGTTAFVLSCFLP